MRIFKKAWLVKKEIGYFKENPLFIIALKRSLFSFKDRRRITKEIKISMAKAGFPSFFSYFWVEDIKGLKSRVEKQKSSLIYKK